MNLSPSSINTFYQSPFLFYLTHIAKAPDDTSVPVCYGLSGNIVHSCLERYTKREFDRDEASVHLLSQWEKQNLHIHRDARGGLLDPNEYLRALMHGISLVDQHEDHVCEETIRFPLKENDSLSIGIKGIIDLQAIEKASKQHVIIDYKTSNSISSDTKFEQQALFYNFLIYKKKQQLPAKTTVHYLKLGASKEYLFTLNQLEAWEQELHRVADTILAWGHNADNYPLGKIDDLFNSKRKACLRERERRKEK